MYIIVAFYDPPRHHPWTIPTARWRRRSVWCSSSAARWSSGCRRPMASASWGSLDLPRCSGTPGGDPGIEMAPEFFRFFFLMQKMECGSMVFPWKIVIFYEKMVIFCFPWNYPVVRRKQRRSWGNYPYSQQKIRLGAVLELLRVSQWCTSEMASFPVKHCDFPLQT